MTPVSRTVYSYRKADWTGLRKSIGDSNLTEKLRACGNDIDKACSTWTNTLKRVINQYIPVLKIKNINSPPWIDGDVLHLSNKKETAHRKGYTRVLE